MRRAGAVGGFTAVAIAAVLTVAPVGAEAEAEVQVGSCLFDRVGASIVLRDDCETASTIEVPDGSTLDGAGHTITATPGIGMLVVRTAPGSTVAHVTNVTITASPGLQAMPCGWLIGVGMGAGVSGSVTGTTVTGVHRGPLSCYGDVGIYVDNPRNWPATNVVLAGNTVDGYVEQGIRVQGNVAAEIVHNRVISIQGDVDDHNITNGLVLSPGFSIGVAALQGDPHGRIAHNHVTAADNDGFPGWASTGMSLATTGDLDVMHNLVDGQVDVGISAWSSGSLKLVNNTLVRAVDDSDVDPLGLGIWFQNSAGNTKAVRNTFSGWNEQIRGDVNLARANGEVRPPAI